MKQRTSNDQFSTLTKSIQFIILISSYKHDYRDGIIQKKFTHPRIQAKDINFGKG